MSSLPRRMQRIATRRKPSGIPQFGATLGVHNPRVKVRQNASKSRAKPAIPASDFNGLVM